MPHIGLFGPSYTLRGTDGLVETRPLPEEATRCRPPRDPGNSHIASVYAIRKLELETVIGMADKDEAISAEDRRKLRFALSQSSKACWRSDEASFLRTIATSGEDRFRGWEGTLANNPFPFPLGDLLPRCNTLGESRNKPLSHRFNGS
jgi:hypothetical protein